MTYSEGGYIEESGRRHPPIVRDGCEYYIPACFAQEWAEKLKQINEEFGLDKPDSDVL